MREWKSGEPLWPMQAPEPGNVMQEYAWVMAYNSAAALERLEALVEQGDRRPGVIDQETFDRVWNTPPRPTLTEEERKCIEAGARALDDKSLHAAAMILRALPDRLTRDVTP